VGLPETPTGLRLVEGPLNRLQTPSRSGAPSKYLEDGGSPGFLDPRLNPESEEGTDGLLGGGGSWHLEWHCWDRESAFLFAHPDLSQIVSLKAKNLGNPMLFRRFQFGSIQITLLSKALYSIASHSPIHTPTAVPTLQGNNQHVRSS